MEQKIIFTNASSIPNLEKPIPASKDIPSWYAGLDSYIGGKKRPDGGGETTSTIKKCMPVFDSMVSGYLIRSYTDVFVTIKNNISHFEWPSLNTILFHPISQAPNHPYFNGKDYPKWNNVWSIKTPKGYSTLFVQPFHRESVFTIMPGVVDTDTYTGPVNFPFVLNDPNFEGLIPKGTPIAQVIPFKRDDWHMEFGKEKEFKEQENTVKNLRTLFFDSYKTMFRQKKQYK